MTHDQLDSTALARFIAPPKMRSSVYKCPNHLGCTIGYHGDDVEVPDGMPAVCSECGSPLKPAKRPSGKLGAYLVNLFSVACIAAGLWLAWPGMVKLWKRYVSPGAIPVLPGK